MFSFKNSSQTDAGGRELGVSENYNASKWRSVFMICLCSVLSFSLAEYAAAESDGSRGLPGTSIEQLYLALLIWFISYELPFLVFLYWFVVRPAEMRIVRAVNGMLYGVALLVIEVYDITNDRIYRAENPRLFHLQGFHQMMMEAWCERHYIEENYIGEFIERAEQQRYEFLWPGHEQIWYFYEGELHLELPDDMFALERVVVSENKNMHCVHIGSRHESRRDFMIRMARFLAPPIGRAIVIQPADISHTMVIQAYSHEGDLIFRGQFYWADHRTFAQQVYRSWMRRHAIDDEFYGVLDSMANQRHYPMWWPGHQQYWFVYNGMLHLETTCH